MGKKGKKADVEVVTDSSGWGRERSDAIVADVVKRNAENLLAWMKNETPQRKPKESNQFQLQPLAAIRSHNIKQEVDSDSLSEISFDLNLSCDLEEHSSDEEHEQVINLGVESYLKSTSILQVSENDDHEQAINLRLEKYLQSTSILPVSLSDESDYESEDDSSEDEAEHQLRESSDWASNFSDVEEQNNQEYLSNIFLLEQKHPVAATEDISHLDIASFSSPVAVFDSDEESRLEISKKSLEIRPQNVAPHTLEDETSDEELSSYKKTTDWIKSEPDDAYDSPSSVITVDLVESENESVKCAEAGVPTDKLDDKSEIIGRYNLRYGYEKIRQTPAKPRDFAYRKEEWVCHLCNKKLKYASRFLHLQKQHDGIHHLCKFCNKGFKRKATLKYHLVQAHPDELNKTYSCLYCSFSYKSRETLDRHVKLIHPKTRKHHYHKCLMCNEIFLTNNELGDHYKKEHFPNNGGVFQCNLCDKKFIKSTSLKHHLLTKHNPKGELPFKCDICDYSAVTNAKIRKHKLVHKGSREDQGNLMHSEHKITCAHTTAVQRDSKSKDSIVCDQCGIVCTYCRGVFQTRQRFLLHTHRLCCGICRMRFKNGKDFKLHIAYHEHPDVICFRCEICKFGFVSVGRLNIHSVKMHKLKMSLSSYKCDKCNKTFSKPQFLSIHKKIHSPNITCPWCPKQFSSVTVRDHHLMNIHTMERPYKCQDCKLAFVRRTDLLRHSRKLHDSCETSEEIINNES